MHRELELEIELKEKSISLDLICNDNKKLSEILIGKEIELAILEEENKRLKSMKFYRHPVSVAMLTFSSCMIINNIFSWIVYYFIKEYT